MQVGGSFDYTAITPIIFCLEIGQFDVCSLEYHGDEPYTYVH